MPQILHYTFFQNALISGILLACISALLGVSLIFACFSVVVGLFSAHFLDTSAGASIVLILIILFLGSLILRRK